MTKNERIDLLLNPFCMADRDAQAVTELCNELNLDLEILNPWEIGEDQLAKLPDYLQVHISEVRSGVKPGSVYSQLFVNGKRIHLKPNNLKNAKQLIQDLIGEGR